MANRETRFLKLKNINPLVEREPGQEFTKKPKRHMGACDVTTKGKIAENQIDNKIVMVPKSLEFQNQVQLWVFTLKLFKRYGLRQNR